MTPQRPIDMPPRLGHNRTHPPHRMSQQTPAVVVIRDCFTIPGGLRINQPDRPATRVARSGPVHHGTR